MSDLGPEGPIWEQPPEPGDPGPRQPQPGQPQPSPPGPQPPLPGQPAPGVPALNQPAPGQATPAQRPYDPPLYDEPRYDQQYFDQQPYDPPPWGETPYNPPPAGQPADGETPYDTGDRGQPPDASNTVKVALIAVVGVLVLVAAIVAAVLLTGDNGKPTAKASSAPASTPGAAPSSNDFPSASPTTSDAPSSGVGSSGAVQIAPTVVAGRAVVERYLADINTKDEADAVTLICTDKRAAWRSSIHGPSGDFTVSIAKYVFTSSRPGPSGSLDLTYTVTATKGTASGTRPATFMLVSEIGGPKICGES